MKLHHLLLSFSLIGFASTAAAQEGDAKKSADPTAPSKEIVQQENAIRGLARLKKLEAELAQVNKLLEKLTLEREQAAAEQKREREQTAAEIKREREQAAEKLKSKDDDLAREREQAAAKLKSKDEEIQAIRNEVQQKQALREAVPAFQLIGLVHTEARSIAVIQAGDRAYWLRDKQEMQLKLSTGAKVQITCSIKSPDAIELTIPELSMTEIISFHTTAPKSAPKARTAD